MANVTNELVGINTADPDAAVNIWTACAARLITSGTDCVYLTFESEDGSVTITIERAATLEHVETMVDALNTLGLCSLVSAAS